MIKKNEWFIEIVFLVILFTKFVLANFVCHVIVLNTFFLNNNSKLMYSKTIAFARQSIEKYVACQ